MAEPEPRTLADVAAGIALLNQERYEQWSEYNSYMAGRDIYDPNDAPIILWGLWGLSGVNEWYHQTLAGLLVEALGIIGERPELTDKELLEKALRGLDEHMREKPWQG